MKCFRVCAATVAVIGIALVFVSPPESQAGGYGGGQAGAGGTTEELAAGEMTGSVGWLVEDSTTGTGTSSMSTTGSVGAVWDGWQHEHADDDGEGGLNVFHSYDWDDNNSGTLLTIVLQSNVVCSGSAELYDPHLNDPQWWWDSTNTVVEDEPTAYAHVPGGGSPDLYIHWYVSKPAQAAGGDYGDQHATPRTSNNEGPPPYGTTSTSGIYASQTTRDWGTQIGSTLLPDEDGASVHIQASWDATARGCVDNAKVHTDKLELSYNFTTTVGP